MKTKVARAMVSALLDDDPAPRDAAEHKLLADMATKTRRENLADLLQSLGREGLRGWVEALLQTATESPATAQAAADSWLESLEPVLMAAGMMLREQVH
ncbi:hypothetical protein HF670_07455 [Acidithiobacillus thiooxidans]|jgi:hypothetical protein|uniref:hypothetical protein n=1 Tax=Acidithiobacillus thiooxidans TaxID=930 RepID=UPI001C069E66|nr:hypothetical protein [Acidithiobacillus thiooxidans]MBU2839401.1 hypothetical protein [Acidithiobacillus thiooxidans]